MAPLTVLDFSKRNQRNVARGVATLPQTSREFNRRNVVANNLKSSHTKQDCYLSVSRAKLTKCVTVEVVNFQLRV